MTRAETALKLLSLEPLIFDHFRFYTGWPHDECEQVLAELTKTKQVTRIPRNGQYPYKASRNHFAGQGDAQQAAAI